MAGIKRFADVTSWQKGRELCRMVYRSTNSGKFSRDFGLRDQMRRLISIISSIME